MHLLKVKNLIKNSLVLKVTSANVVLVLIRMGFSLITQKVLAIFIGSEGIAQVGNLKNVFQFFEQFSILGTSNGIVKYVSEYRDNKKSLNDLFSTCLCFSGLAAIISFIILFFFASSLNSIIFSEDYQFGYVFKILAFIVPFMGVNAILTALLNGTTNYKQYSKITLVSIILTAFLLVFLTVCYGVIGSLVAITVSPIIIFIVSMFFLSNSLMNIIELKNLTFKLNFKSPLLTYSVMSVVVILFINITEVAIRNLIEKNININEAGYWTAMTSISKSYMQFSAAIFPMYILPKYAKISNSFEFRNEVFKIYKLLIPLLILGMLLIYLLKEIIIQILYSKEFLGIEMYFKWQLLGDFIKFIAIVLSYQFLAKKQVAYFVFTELLSVFLFYFFSVYFINVYGAEGVVIAHFVRYVIYFFVVLFILRFNFLGKNRVFKN